MINVKLEIWKKGPYIKAPQHCSYKFEDSYGEGDGYEKSFVVNPSLCFLCKLCQFESNIQVDKLEIKVEKFITYLTFTNTEVSVSINNQNFYLKKQDRIPIAILINPEVFDMMLKLVYKDDEFVYSHVHTYILNNEIPICYILGCPVYLSRKLTKSKVMVVGEIEWK